MLEYSDVLQTTLADPGAPPLPSGDPREVELRAASIWAIELLRRAWPVPDARPLAVLIDYYLWDYAVAHRDALAATCPMHRTRTIYY
jgi:hypothetical protein